MAKKRTLSHAFGHISHASYVRKEYIKMQPGSKVVKFSVGTHQDYTHQLTLISLKEFQLMEGVLESLRISLGHSLKPILKQYQFQIYPYPHEILRQHAMLGIAKAERFMKGMRKSFGRKKIGKAAHINVNQPILRLWVFEKDIPIAKKALQVAQKKLPIPSKFTIEKAGIIPKLIAGEIEEKLPEKQIAKEAAITAKEEKKPGKMPPKIEQKGRVR